MNGLGNQLFSRSRIPSNQNGRRSACDPANLLENLQHCCRPGEHPLKLFHMFQHVITLITSIPPYHQRGCRIPLDFVRPT